MKNFCAIFIFLIFSFFTKAQFANYPQEVKVKMDQNKIDGVPTFSGINFDHIVTISSGISDKTYKNNDLKITEVINQVRNELGFLHANFERLESGDLIFHFIGQFDINVDSIKLLLTSKNLMSTSIEVNAKIVQ